MATTATTPAVNKGGSFLLESSRPEDIFTPAEITDDQRLIGQTADEFVTKEVVPLAGELEQHKEGLMASLLRKAGELGLCGGGVPEAYGGSGLDKISATVLAEKLSSYASFAVTHGGHAGIGTLPIVYFGTEEQKKKYLPKLATGEWIGCYCLSEPQAGSDAQNLLTRAVLSPDGKQWISERPEDVDHQRRVCGRVHHLCESGRREVLLLHRRARFSGLSSVGAEEKKMGIKGSSTVPMFFENCRMPEGESAARNRRAATSSPSTS